MYITGELVKVQKDEYESFMATVLHRYENNSYDVLLYDTGEILNVLEDSVTTTD